MIKARLLYQRLQHPLHTVPIFDIPAPTRMRSVSLAHYVYAWSVPWHAVKDQKFKTVQVRPFDVLARGQFNL